MSGMRAAILAVLVLMLGACSSLSNHQKDAGANPEKTLEAFTQLGLQYLRAGDTVSAKDALQRALKIRDDYAPTYNALGLVFQMEQENALAEKEFRKAVELAPDSASFHNNYGAFLYAQKRYKEACDELERATEDPFYARRAQAFENLGRCFRMIDRTDAAEHAFERSLRLESDRPLALLELSDIDLNAGKVADAQKYFDQFSKMVEARQVEHSAQSLWLGIRLARLAGNSTKAATYSLLLKNLYPKSDEYKRYKESMQ